MIKGMIIQKSNVQTDKMKNDQELLSNKSPEASKSIRVDFLNYQWGTGPIKTLLFQPMWINDLLMPGVMRYQFTSMAQSAQKQYQNSL